MFKQFAAAAGALLLMAGAANAVDLSGAGATFPAPVYAKWAEAYKAASGNGLNYQAIGSGGGINQIKAKTVDFGASDKPLKPEDLNAAGLYQFPTVIGGVVPVMNLPGIKPGQVKLTGELLGDIFMGSIKSWSDPKIAAVNKGVKLPNLPITVVHRSDGSGTSFLFTTYLSMKAQHWASEVGGNDSVNWPTRVVKAAPITMPTARSTTFPRRMNFLNSPKNFVMACTRGSGRRPGSPSWGLQVAFPNGGR